MGCTCQCHDKDANVQRTIRVLILCCCFAISLFIGGCTVVHNGWPSFEKKEGTHPSIQLLDKASDEMIAAVHKYRYNDGGNGFRKDGEKELIACLRSVQEAKVNVARILAKQGKVKPDAAGMWVVSVPKHIVERGKTKTLRYTYHDGQTVYVTIDPAGQ